ncbi:E7 [Trichechus manatus papillomavirus]|nr:E7 [Trichechus manatus papillomavirus]
MIGTEATLKDIILSEYPPQPNHPVNLLCHEELPPETEEEEESEPCCPYRILLGCAHCKRAVKLVVVCSGAGIYNLQQLLFDDVRIICPLCATQHNY